MLDKAITATDMHGITIDIRVKIGHLLEVMKK
jgi:hypothetical protein